MNIHRFGFTMMKAPAIFISKQFEFSEFSMKQKTLRQGFSLPERYLYCIIKDEKLLISMIKNHQPF